MKLFRNNRLKIAWNYSDPLEETLILTLDKHIPCEEEPKLFRIEKQTTMSVESVALRTCIPWNWHVASMHNHGKLIKKHSKKSYSKVPQLYA